MIKHFIRNIVNALWLLIYGRWSQADKEKLYDSLIDIFALSQWLYANKFKWSSDGLNACEPLDTFERPEDVLARKFANCSGYLRLFEDFAKYKKSKGIYIATSYVQYELTNNEKWHYVAVYMINGSLWLQTNMIIEQTTTDIPLLKRFPDYNEFKIIDSWTNI